MVKGHYKRFSFNRQLENFHAIGEGLIGGFGGWISGQGQRGVEAGFATGYGDARSFQKRRKKWLRKSIIGSASSVYGSSRGKVKYGSNPRPPVYGSNPHPPIYGSPPIGKAPGNDPVAKKIYALGNFQLVDLDPFVGYAKG